MCVHKIQRDSTLNLDLETGIDTCDYEDLNNSIQCDSGDLSVLQYNIRGLNSKLCNLNNLLDKLQNNGYPDVLLICESWLKTNSPKPHIAGYNIERNDRRYKKGGGVCILLSNKYKYKRRLNLEQFNCIYRPPNTNPQEFIDTIKKVVPQAKKNGRNIILGMDHNLDILKENKHGPTHDFLEGIYDNGLLPMITKPTRITTSSATLIDNILVDDLLYGRSESGIILDDSSDHLPCYCIVRDLNPHRAEDIEITSRDTRKKNLSSLKKHLKTKNPLLPLHRDNVNEQFNNFHTNTKTLLIEQYLPLTRRKIPHRKIRKEPWVSAGLMISINKNKKLYKKYLKQRHCRSTEAEYKKYNQELKRVKRAAWKKVLH